MTAESPVQTDQSRTQQSASTHSVEISDAASIAGKLTEAQRRALTRHYRDGQPTALHPGDPQVATLGVLARHGLLAGPSWSRSQQFTPLGLAVRAYLLERQS